MAELADFYMNTSYEFDITITADGETPNVTGDEVMLLFRRNGTRSRYAFPGDVSDGATGKVMWRLTPEQTDVLLPGHYSYQIVWVRADGDVHVVLAGTLKVIERIEQP